MARTPSNEEVERRAYEIWEKRGREEGHALEHWVTAERECAAAEPERFSRAATPQASGRR